MELEERFREGDAQAFELLFRQYQREVYAWIVRIVRNAATAEDLTIETFWRVYRARTRFDAAKGSFPVWLRRIATHAALDHLRQKRPEVDLPADFPDARIPPPGRQSDERRAISKAMNRMSPKLRVTVLLALVEEEPYENIAQSMGITVGAVKTRVFRGVRILRKLLSKQGVRP